jgi:hypothetical protein
MVPHREYWSAWTVLEGAMEMRGISSPEATRVGITPKKTYHTPRFSAYGSVVKLTQGGGGASTDAGGTKAHRPERG